MSRRGALLVAIACAARVAHADADLAAINGAFDNSDYAAAQELVAKALAGGGNSPEATAELYRLQGIALGSLGSTQPATEAFQRALALNPKLALAAGTSPKIGRPFEAAKNFFKSAQPLKVKVETQQTPPSVTLVVVSDPLKMIARARVAVVIDGGAEKMVDGIGTIALPAGNRLDLRVAVLDPNGNRLVEIGSSDVPLVIVSRGAPPTDPKQPPKKQVVVDEPRGERPLYAKWWLWGGAAVVFAGAGTGFGLWALAGKNELEDLRGVTFDEATALEDRVRTRVLLTNISYGVAIGAGVTATILFLTKPRARERSTITVAPMRDGGAIVVGGEF